MEYKSFLKLNLQNSVFRFFLDFLFLQNANFRVWHMGANIAILARFGILAALAALAALTAAQILYLRRIYKKSFF